MKIIDINGNERDCVKAYPDKDYPGYMRVEFKTAIRSHHEWWPIKEFIKYNPNLISLTKGAPKQVEETLGIVSSSSDITLTDKKQKWEEGSYIDFPVWISRGKGEGQIRKVLFNSKDTVTVDKPWDTKPDKTSQYVISHNIHDPQPLGNALPGMDKKARN